MGIFTKPGTGALLDTRSGEEKLKDYKFEEIVAAVNPVNWVEKGQSAWRKFPIFNQNGSGSCVAQTGAKLLGIMYWLLNGIYVHFSATDLYQRRSNRPGGGMIGVNAFDIMTKGVTLEELVPSQNMSDAQMDGVAVPDYKRKVGEIFKIASNFVQPPIKDIDTIASIIQTTGKGVMVWFYFDYAEWTDHPFIKFPTLDLYAAATCRHSVTAVDFALVNGVKCLIIEDSWGPTYGLGGQRVIDETFFKTRNWFAAYPVNFQFNDQVNPQPQPQPQPAPGKPHHVFNTDMELNDKNAEVVALQDCLKYDGDFPTNTASTGLYGSITVAAVKKFQDKYNIAHAGNAGYGRTGPKTREKLNQIFGQ